MRGSVKAEITPMFKQYFEVKHQYPDAVLFFRLGDFYEMFFEDAETVAPLLGLVLTKREAGKGLTAPMCGVPVEKALFYIQKLVDLGFKVAICEQVEDPATSKGLVKREVVKIYTPGLMVDLELPEKSKTYLASLYLDKKAGLAFLELSCGEFIFTEVNRETFLSELLKREPREILCLEEFAESEWISLIKGSLPKVHLSFLDKRAFGLTQVEDLLKFPYYERYQEGLKAANAILVYLQNYQPHLLDKIEAPVFYYPEEFLFLDEATKRNLELVKNLWDGSEKYSLFWVLDATVTPMGARLLKEWIIYPLRDINQIKLRQEAVSFLVEKPDLRDALREVLKKLPDLERLSTKCSLRLINPKEMALLRDSLKYLPEIKEIFSEIDQLPRLLRDILSQLGEFTGLYQRLCEVLVENPPYTLKDGGIIKRGIDPTLDELRDLKDHAVDYLSAIERKEREKTGIPNLRIGYNRVFGYYFEVSKGNVRLVPPYFERKQTLTNVERFVTPELKELEQKIITAEEKIKNLEYELFLGLREEVAQYKEDLKRTSLGLATLDVLVSLAKVAVENDYVCPEITEEEGLYIEEGRHPVIEKIQGKERFIPNSVELKKDEAVLLVITGPNMGGKSTYLRQTALIVIMAQMGSFVPAKYARLGVFDKVFTRIGAGDELARGKSTFMVEMSECAYILKNATSKSLVLLDEVGRGTSTYDGMSLAWAIAENLYEKKVFTLLATHYFELTELGKIYTGIKNYHVAVKEWQDDIIFMYKVLPGAANKSHGIEVAKLAGIPQEVVDRAKEILYKLEGKNLKEPSETKIASKRVTQLSIFDREHPVLQKIRNLNIEEITPIEALNFLWEIKKELK
ncbi:DNA mismatch repair protein MutS [Thermodesulfobacterium sp.]|jgi:DNA mismatch repair protein MutS|uniref:DNA mismatch repair protein MutS n=1 Tax=Thermodesulfobacterium sp. TaxID=1965289 RepID=UPI0026485B2F|nr:DNA mismatch repair protein MutS [Thermodesulfobacterium sp.]MDN5379631.1 mismatch repair protein MutS [Thermodesulfobacterium sp.]